MLKLQKMKVLLREQDLEEVNLYLCDLGVSQYIELDFEHKESNGIPNYFHPYKIPNDEILKINEIKARIERDLDELGIELKKRKKNVNIYYGHNFREILSKIEQKLAKIEEKINEISGHKVIDNESDDSLLSQYCIDEDLDEVAAFFTDEEGTLKKPIKEDTEEQFVEMTNVYNELATLYRMDEEIKELVEAEKCMASAETVVYFEAWVLSKYINNIKDNILQITHDKVVIDVKKPTEKDNVPRVIKDSSLLLQPFSGIVKSLGCPRKKEINPTKIIAFTFPFLFGFMFADVGQGIILTTFGLYLLWRRSRADMDEVKEIFGYLLKASGGMVLCGISAMFFGYIFGEYFGPSGRLHPVLIFEFGPFQFGGFDPMHHPLTLLRLTIGIGVVFISFALSISVLNHLMRKEFSHAIASICWIWFLVGGCAMWVKFKGISQITTWFGEGLPWFIALVILPMVLMFITMSIKDGFMEGMDITIEVFIETLGHTLSFCRLAALFLTHTALSSMFLDLAGVEDGYFPPSSIPLIAVGVVLALAIEGLLVMVHVLRLHWVELLPKFYSGDGIPFEPLNFHLENEEEGVKG